MSAEHTLTCRIPVRWSDLDALGHVNNARYFTYLEEARLAWFDSLPEPWYDDETGPVVARACCDFRQPITGTGELIVKTKPGKPGRSSITLESAITDATGQKVHATGEIVLVWVDRRTGRATALPASIRHLGGES